MKWTLYAYWAFMAFYAPPHKVRKGVSKNIPFNHPIYLFVVIQKRSLYPFQLNLFNREFKQWLNAFFSGECESQCQISCLCVYALWGTRARDRGPSGCILDAYLVHRDIGRHVLSMATQPFKEVISRESQAIDLEWPSLYRCSQINMIWLL